MWQGRPGCGTGQGALAQRVVPSEAENDPSHGQAHGTAPGSVQKEWDPRTPGL